jgi:hypothetical protein
LLIENGGAALAAPPFGSLQNFDFRFQTEAHRAKFKMQLRRLDSDNATWLIALAKEQLALITQDRSHGISFG